MGIAVGVVTSLVATWAYPALLQTFRVTPNAVEMESEFIQRNINATLTAYGLDDIETTNYAAHTEAEPGQLREDAEATAQGARAAGIAAEHLQVDAAAPAACQPFETPPPLIGHRCNPPRLPGGS